MKPFKSIAFLDPNFRALPKGLRQMLMVSEKFFSKKDTAPAKTEDQRAGKEKPENTAPVRSRSFQWGYWLK